MAARAIGCDIGQEGLRRTLTFIPASRSQASKWAKAVRDRLPEWIATTVRPILEEALASEKLEAKLEIGGTDKDKLLLSYPVINFGTGYVQPVVTLEFGGRATGEPHGVMPVTCDMDGYVEDVTFPVASPVVMSVGRTFWEKATAAHVYCTQGRIRGERYARHWHDLAAIARSTHFEVAVSDRAVAQAVAEHKTYFFSEKDTPAKQSTMPPQRTVSSGSCRKVLHARRLRMTTPKWQPTK